MFLQHKSAQTCVSCEQQPQRSRNLPETFVLKALHSLFTSTTTLVIRRSLKRINERTSSFTSCIAQRLQPFVSAAAFRMALAAVFALLLSSSTAVATVLGCYVSQPRVDSIRAEATNCTGPCRGALKAAITNLSVDSTVTFNGTFFGAQLAPDENGGVVMVWLGKYVATGDTAALNSAFNFIDNAWNNANFKVPGETQFDAAYPGMLMAAALTLDLGFDGLTPAQQTTLLNDIHSASSQLWTAINSATPPYWKDTVLQNHNWSSWGSLGVGACALAKYPNTPYATDASTWLNAAASNFTSVHSKVQAISDGTWHEGQSYGGSVHSLTFIYTILQNAGVADFITDSTASPSYFKAYVNFLLGSYMPDAAREGPDYHGDFFGFSIEPPAILRWAAWKYGASAPQLASSAQWMANSWRSGGFHFGGSTSLVSGYDSYTPDDASLVFELLNWDTGVLASSSTPPAASSDLYLGDAQMFTMRAATDASGSNTMLLTLKSGNLGGDAEWHHICDNNGQNKGTIELNYGHDHSDDNGVYLTFGKDQLVPEGAGYFIGHADSPGEPANLTVYHNSLLVDGHGQFGGGHWTYNSADSLSAGVHGEDDTSTWYCNRYGHLQYHTATTSFAYAMGDGKSLYYQTQASLFATPPDYVSPLQRFDRHVFMSRANGGRYGIVRDVIESTSAHSYELDWHFEASQVLDTGWLHGTSQTGGEVGIFVAAPSGASILTTQTQSPVHTADFDGLSSYHLSQVQSSGANVTFLNLIAPIGAVGGLWANRPAVSVPAGDLVAGGSLLVTGAFNGGATETEQWIFNRLPTDTRSSGTTPHSLSLSGIAGVIATNVNGAVIRAGLFEGTDVQYDGQDELSFNAAVDSGEARWNGATVTVEWNATNSPTLVQVKANGATQATFDGQAGTCNATTCSSSTVGLFISNVQATTPSPTSATITWTTNAAADSTVNYGVTTAYGTSQHDVTQVTQHSISLTGLTANTTYHYQVVSANASTSVSSADFTFTTPTINTFQLTLVTPLALSPGSPGVNQPVTATFTVKNTGTASGAVQYFLAQTRDPSNANVDFPNSGAQTIAPGASFTYTATRSFATAGTYSASPVYFDGTNLVPLAPAPSTFNVQAALFADDFNRTTGLGANWAVGPGSFSTDGSNAVGGTMTGTGTGNWAKVVPALNTNNYAVSADMIVPAGSLFSGLVARSSAASFDSTLYAAQIATDGNVYLYRRNNWNWLQLASAAAGIVANTSYNLRLVVSGDTPVHLEAWVNGVQKIVFDDNDSVNQIKTGVPGMQNYDTNTKYDNFTVTTAPLFADDFNRTTGLGANWSVPHGSFTTDGSSAVSGTMTSTGTGNWAKVSSALNANDYSVAADLIVPSGSLDSGLVARSSDSVNFDSTLYAAQIATDGNINLYRRNNWTWTPLASAAGGIVAGVSYNLKLVVSGANPVHLEVWLNGVQKIVFNDSSASQITTGSAGMQNYDTGVKYDNFTITAP
jgi:purple acid phosphatase-like protein